MPARRCSSSAPRGSRSAPIGEVDADFAAAEGEGDGSLDYWRAAHWAYFSRRCEALGRAPSNDMPVILERFALIYPAGAIMNDAPPVQTTLDSVLGGRVTLHQPAVGYRVAIDPILLAAACPAEPGERVVDLGCGVGTAALCLARRVADVQLHRYRPASRSGGPRQPQRAGERPRRPRAASSPATSSIARCRSTPGRRIM